MKQLQQHMKPLNLRAMACGFVALMLAMLLAFMPTFAHATDFSKSAPSSAYTDVITVVAKGDPFTAKDIPNGTYVVEAESSSPTMGRIPEAKIVVKDGKMTAVFKLTASFTHVYPGTADEAAAASGADGTDSSEYIAGKDPDAKGYRTFSMNIASLNELLYFAAFNGNSSNHSNYMWYDRTAAFFSTPEIEAAVAQKKKDDADAKKKAEEEKKKAEEEAKKKAEEAAKKKKAEEAAKKKAEEAKKKAEAERKRKAEEAKRRMQGTVGGSRTTITGRPSTLSTGTPYSSGARLDGSDRSGFGTGNLGDLGGNSFKDLGTLKALSVVDQNQKEEYNESTQEKAAQALGGQRRINLPAVVAVLSLVILCLGIGVRVALFQYQQTGQLPAVIKCFAEKLQGLRKNRK